jgi:hypothetical protein
MFPNDNYSAALPYGQQLAYCLLSIFYLDRVLRLFCCPRVASQACPMLYLEIIMS